MGKASSGGPKALSAYMHFCSERRPGLTAALKTKLGAEFQNKLVMVNLGSEWRELSDLARPSSSKLPRRRRLTWRPRRLRCELVRSPFPAFCREGPRGRSPPLYQFSGRTPLISI